jgi:predicted metal-dependent hydrolase
MDEIAYTVRRSGRARRVRVTVDAARGVEVVLPRRAAEREAVAAIRELRPWVERRVAELERARAAVAARGDSVPYMGTALRLVAQPGRARVHRRGQELLVPDGPARNAALERWYRRAAASEIPPRLDRACELTGNS